MLEPLKRFVWYYARNCIIFNQPWPVLFLSASFFVFPPFHYKGLYYKSHTIHQAYTRLGLPFVRHIEVSCCLYFPSPPIMRFSTTSTMQAIYSNQFNSNQLYVFTGLCGQELFRKFRGTKVQGQASSTGLLIWLSPQVIVSQASVEWRKWSHLIKAGSRGYEWVLIIIFQRPTCTFP